MYEAFVKRQRVLKNFKLSIHLFTLVFDKPDKVPAKALGAGPPDNTKTVNLSQPTTSADQGILTNSLRFD